MKPVILGDDHPAIRAQLLIDELIATSTATFGVYANNPQPSMNVLSDVRALAQRALTIHAHKSVEHVIPPELLAQLPAGSIGQSATRRKPAAAAAEPSLPAQAATAASGVVAALAALQCPDIASAGRKLQWMVAHSQARGYHILPLKNRRSWQTTPVLDTVELAALETVLKPTDQLRFCSGSLSPSRPTPTTTATANALARTLPTTLWPAWSLRLELPGWDHSYVRLALSGAVQIVGSTLRLGEALALVDSPLKSTLAVSRVLRSLERHKRWPDIREALIRMADHLRTHGAPIDYHRRRHLDHTGLLPDDVWRRICRDTGYEGAHPARAKTVRCFVFERISGMPIEMSPSADDNYQFRRAVADFPSRLTAEIRDALTGHATEFLQAHGLTGEPAFWQPPADVLRGLNLPGPDFTTVDAEAVRKLPVGRTRIAQCTKQFGISKDAARYLAEMQVAHPPSWVSGDAARPARGGAYRVAKDALPRDKLVDLYVGQRQSCAAIGASIGVSKPVIRRLVEEYGLTLREPGPKVKHIFERDWLIEEYVHKQRSQSDIAAEVGVAPASVGRWLAKLRIPARPAGPTSHAAALAALTASRLAPEILRPALTTQGGWTRLHHFVESASYPTFAVAAEHLALNRHMLCQQITRIENELGQKLIERAERGRPMTLTPAGARVVAAINLANAKTQVREGDRSGGGGRGGSKATGKR